jgi:hypothetical protein
LRLSDGGDGLSNRGNRRSARSANFGVSVGVVVSDLLSASSVFEAEQAAIEAQKCGFSNGGGRRDFINAIVVDGATD